MANINGRFALRPRARLRNGILICPLVPRVLYREITGRVPEPTSLGRPGWPLERL
jgi:hypothetical protein